MLEVLQQQNPGAMDLPEQGEISSYIGSLVARKKKGIIEMPQARAAPIPDSVKKIINELGVLWETTDHKIPRATARGGMSLKAYTRKDIYDQPKADHDARGGTVPFPPESKVFALLGAQRKARKELNTRTLFPEQASPLGKGVLLR